MSSSTPLELALQRLDKVFKLDDSIVQVVAEVELTPGTVPFATPFTPVSSDPDCVFRGGWLCVLGQESDATATKFRGWKGSLIVLRMTLNGSGTQRYVFRVGDVTDLGGVWKLTMEDCKCFIDGKAWSYYTVESPTKRMPLGGSGVVGKDLMMWRSTDSTPIRPRADDALDRIDALKDAFLAHIKELKEEGFIKVKEEKQ